MKINLKLFAMLQDYLPSEAKKTNMVTIEVAEGTTVIDVIARFGVPLKMCHLVLVDGHFIPIEQREGRVFSEGETLSIWPPVAGG